VVGPELFLYFGGRADGPDQHAAKFVFMNEIRAEVGDAPPLRSSSRQYTNVYWDYGR
jgi:hypothetical protein